MKKSQSDNMNLFHDIKKIRHIFEYEKILSRRERLYEKLGILLIYVLTAVMIAMFIPVGFNSNLDDYENELAVTVNKIAGRYAFSDSMLISQREMINELAMAEGTLEKLYLEDTPVEEWKDGISLLTDAKDSDDNMEMFYYEDGRLVYKSNNAVDTGLDAASLQAILDSGEAFFDEESTDVYAVLPLGEGMLVCMYRDTGKATAMDMRHFFGATNIAGKNNLLSYDISSGHIYMLSDDEREGDSLSSPDISEIFDNSSYAGSGHFGLSEIMNSLDEYRIMSIDLSDTVRLTGYFSLLDCFIETLHEMLLPAVFLLLAATVLSFGTLGARIVRYPVRARGEFMHLFGNLYLDKLMLKRALSLFATCTVVTGIAATYVTALVFFSQENTEAIDKLVGIENDDTYNEENVGLYTGFRDKVIIDTLDEVTLIVDNNPELRSDKKLKELVNALSRCEAISIYNSKAVSIASSSGFTGYALSNEDGSIGSRIIKVLNSDQHAVLLESDSDGMAYYAAKCSYNSGFIVYTVDNTFMQDVIRKLSDEELLQEADFGRSDVMYYDAEDPDSLTVSYVGSDTLTTINNTIPANALSDNYFGMVSVGGYRYFINVAADSNHEGNYFISAGRFDSIALSIAVTGIIFVLGMSLIFAVLVCLFVPFNMHKDSIITLKSAEDEGDGRAAHIRINAEKSGRLAAEAEGIEGLKRQGRLREIYDFSKEILSENFSGYMHMIMRGCMLIFLAFLMFELFTDSSTGSLVRYLFNTRWEKGLNLFSATMIIIKMVGVWVACSLLLKVVNAVSENVGPAGLTIARMVMSLIKCIAVIIVIVFSLIELGVEMVQIIAGAGLTSVIIGIGAQSTIGNIFTGLSIIFEGHLHVGDIIMIPSVTGREYWTGVIKDIGVKNTCIESFGSAGDYRNIRVIRNSELNDFINMSAKASKAVIVLKLPHEADLDAVEKLFNEHAARMRAELPMILEGPFYGGLAEYESDGKTIRIVAKCEQKDKEIIEYRLRHIFGEILDAAGLGYPHSSSLVANPPKGIYRSPAYIINGNVVRDVSQEELDRLKREAETAADSTDGATDGTDSAAADIADSKT